MAAFSIIVMGNVLKIQAKAWFLFAIFLFYWYTK